MDAMELDARAIAIIAVIAVAPLAIVIIIGLIRGYTFDIHLMRGKKKGEDGEPK